MEKKSKKAKQWRALQLETGNFEAFFTSASRETEQRVVCNVSDITHESKFVRKRSRESNPTVNVLETEREGGRE